ncbi:fructose-bisphosphatase class I [Sesbania bispinosa]|nr:fructose-bisphosphatase class I [Sesbania bispinosa]
MEGKQKKDYEERKRNQSGDTNKAASPKGSRVQDPLYHQHEHAPIPHPKGDNTTTSHQALEIHKEVGEIVANTNNKKDHNVRSDGAPGDKSANYAPGDKTVNYVNVNLSESHSLTPPPRANLNWAAGPSKGKQLCQGFATYTPSSTTKIYLQEGKISPIEGKYEGANLSLIDIRSCRSIIHKSTKQKDTGKSELMREESPKPYFVEFPDEQDQGDPPNASKSAVPSEIESQLIVGWNNSLTLKRNREAPTPNAGDMKAGKLEGNPTKKLKKLKWETGAVLEGTLEELYPVLMSDNFWNMAGEAGQNLPHPQS